MKQKRALPAFKSEAEEAEWWHKKRARLDKDLIDAAKKGKLKRLDPATLKNRLASSKSRVVSIRLPEQDLELARQQATQRAYPTRRTSSPCFTRLCGRRSNRVALGAC